ncbi:MAG: DUF6090 family protein [Bacteroidota bacterium]
MSKFFRRYRQQFFQENRFTKYLLYALGEIILVVIGILIALQINTWNEGRKAQEELTSILKSIAKDLETDAEAIQFVLQEYETKKETSDKLIAGEISLDNFDTYPKTPNLITNYQAFTIQRKGFELLQQLKLNEQSQNDTLIANISEFYNYFDPLLATTNTFMQNSIYNNLEFFQERPWFVEWSQKKVTPEMKTFFIEDGEYRKRVAMQNILGTQNYIRFIQEYQKRADELLAHIQNRLK